MKHFQSLTGIGSERVPMDLKVELQYIIETALSDSL